MLVLINMKFLLMLYLVIRNSITMKEIAPSKEYIDYICRLYGDVYDDRIEDCKPPVAGAERREAGS